MAEVEDKVDEVVAVSDDGDAADCDDGTVSPTPATVPKKRGRPSNSEKPKKAITTTSGRGRGRPAKTEAANKKAVKAAISVDGSEEEGTGSDGGSPKYNGDAAETPTVVASKRGRKPKVKRKISHTVDSTGKGRGRPKKSAKLDDAEDDEAVDDNDDGASSDYKPGKKIAAKSTKKGRGRPKKVQSDDDSSDGKQDDEERRPVGRPPSGGVNLNIVSTGRGQGRPKKEVSEKRVAEAAKRAADAENGGGQIKRQRGRPSTSSKAAYSPTGKARGRPKLAAEEKDSQDDDEDVNTSAKAGENSADLEEENDKASTESEDAN